MYFSLFLSDYYPTSTRKYQTNNVVHRCKYSPSWFFFSSHGNVMLTFFVCTCVHLMIITFSAEIPCPAVRADTGVRTVLVLARASVQTSHYCVNAFVIICVITRINLQTIFSANLQWLEEPIAFTKTVWTLYITFNSQRLFSVTGKKCYQKANENDIAEVKPKSDTKLRKNMLMLFEFLFKMQCKFYLLIWIKHY